MVSAHLTYDPWIWLKVTSMASTLHSLQPFKFYFAHFTMKYPVARMMNRLESIQDLNFCLAISKLRKLWTLEIKKVLENV